MRKLLFRLAVAAVLLAVWELAYRVHLLNPVIFGSPTLVFLAIETDGMTFLKALEVTTLEVLVATAVSWAVGIGFGVFAGTIRFLGDVSRPFLSGIIATPFVILYPVLMAWVGIGPSSKIVFGFLLGAFPIALSTMIGIRSIDAGYAAMATAMGASRHQRIFHVMVPMALPSVMAGLRLGTSLVITGVVLTEMLASTDGIGFWITYNRSLFNTGQVYLGIILAMILTALMNVLLSRFERRYGHWRAVQEELS